MSLTEIMKGVLGKPKTHPKPDLPAKSEMDRKQFIKAVLAGTATIVGGTVLELKHPFSQSLVIDNPQENNSESNNDVIDLSAKAESSIATDSIASAEGKTELNTGLEYLKHYGLLGKMVHGVYGRPKLGDEDTWGSLGDTRTAEESWELAFGLEAVVRQDIENSGQVLPETAYHIINPVYRSGNGTISDIYIEKALELASQNGGLVALDFSSIEDARNTINYLETILPTDYLRFLSISLDAEWFDNQQASAYDINAFVQEFSRKRFKWDPNMSAPGLVFVYTINPDNEVGGINYLDQLDQYVGGNTLVVPIIDGYGTAEDRMPALISAVNQMQNTTENPALVGVMQFKSKWGDKYDQSSISEIFGTLTGAPVSWFFAQ